jgi:hypothetical protein
VDDRILRLCAVFAEFDPEIVEAGAESGEFFFLLIFLCRKKNPKVVVFTTNFGSRRSSLSLAVNEAVSRNRLRRTLYSMRDFSSGVRVRALATLALLLLARVRFWRAIR